MKISDLKPNHALLPYISRYWSWENESQLPSLLPPGSGCELLFFYRKPIDIVQSNGKTYCQATSALLLPRSDYFKFRSDEPIDFISVRFCTGALRHFCPFPVNELIDNCLSAGDVWNKKGNAVERLIRRADGLSERVGLIESFLLEQLEANYKFKHRWLDPVFNHLFYQQKEANIENIVEQCGISLRQFQRVFLPAAGVNPKYYQRIVRMESVTRQLLLTHEKDYLSVALDNGYYDQSHFIKECRHFIGTTPGLFFNEDNFMSHFYNPSLKN